MPAGRPTKYNQQMIDKAIAYIEGDHLSQDDVIPSHPGLAQYLGVTRSTIYLWSETHPEFSDILGKLMDRQCRMTLSGGISGVYNATIAKLVLGKHGYTDKVDNTLSSPSGGPIQIEYAGVKSDGKR